MKKTYTLLLVLLSMICFSQKKINPKVLIFSKNASWAYRHASIEKATISLAKLCKSNQIDVQISEDATLFNDTTLNSFATLVLLSANQDIFDADQEAALQRYIRAGGGFVGIHSTSGVERNWSWFNKMLGATFVSHPPQQKGTIKILNSKHPATKGLPQSWNRYDEWYYFGPIINKINVLAILDTTTFKSTTHTQNYPSAWYQAFEGGRIFYTAGGHNAVDFEDSLFKNHLLGGIKYAIGNNKKLDYSQNSKYDQAPLRIITLDPGHFHAALVQKTMLPGLNPTVSVYAPDGPDLKQHLNYINGYNNRTQNPTNWKEEVYAGEDFFEKMITKKNGDVVIMSGNNAKKTNSIFNTVQAGLHVLADKPMCIDKAGYEKLTEAFKIAKKNDVLLYDIMTERSEITTLLQRELSMLPNLFGKLHKGSIENPAIIKESTHHFYKQVSGSPLIRPQWFMDTQQQGEGIVDVTTHLVDLAHWAAFPETPLTLKDAQVLEAKRWTTTMTIGQFKKITGANMFPDFLKKDITSDTLLNIYANGQIDFKLKENHARVKVLWNYSASSGGDTHYSILKGTKANLEIRQNAAENFITQLYIIPSELTEDELKIEFDKLQSKFPGITLVKKQNEWLVDIPQKYRTNHEAHFGEVMERFLKYKKVNNLPDWEVPNMLLKYYITTTAYEMALKN